MHLCWSGPTATAQSMEDLNLQMHGYATQGFIYTTNNNWNTADTTDGSPAWTEAVINVTVQPRPKLRIGVQPRFFCSATMATRSRWTGRRETIRSTSASAFAWARSRHRSVC